MVAFEKYNVVDYARALGLLSQLCADKRYQVLESRELAGDGGLLALQINSEISAEYGLDILKINSERQIDEYEDILALISYQHAFETIPDRSVGDEKEFIDKCASFSVDKFKQFRIVLQPKGVEQDLFTKEFLRSIGLSYLDYMSYASTPDYVVMFDTSKGTKFFFTSTHIKHRNRKKILFSCFQTALDVAGKPTSKTYFTDERQLAGSNILGVRALFILESEDFELYFDSPVKILFKLLSRYGIDLEVNNSIKRLFVDTFFLENKTFKMANNIQEFIENIVDEGGYKIVLTILMASPVTVGYKINLFFMLDYNSYLRDLRENNI